SVVRRLLVIILVLGLKAAAQQPGVSIGGAVLDPQQAGVFAATVTLRSTGGVQVSSASAGQSGDFRFRNVAPGNYEIVVDREGFKSAVTRVRVGNQPSRPLTITLSLADVRQEITVGVEPGQVSATTSENLDAVTLERSTLDNLPIFDQDYIATMSRFLDSIS